MMKTVYSTYEAKSKLSELLRLVRAGKTIRITYRGEAVAEVRPIQKEISGFEERLRDMVFAGTVVRSTRPAGTFSPVKRTPGGLKRFLAERDS